MRTQNSAVFISACMHEFSTPQDMTSISAVTNATHTGISTPISNVILCLMCRTYTAKYPSPSMLPIAQQNDVNVKRVCNFIDGIKDHYS